MKLLIKNATIIDCSQTVKGDIYINQGKIHEIGRNLDYACKAIDVKGRIILPSFIDMHTHFRDPGYTQKEDIYTGSLAALKGGFTQVNTMANTRPICSDMKIVNYVLNKSKKIDLIDISQTVSITKNFDGVTLSHIDDLNDCVKFLSDDGKGVKRNEIMYHAMVKAKNKGITIISHAEDEDLTSISSRISENFMTMRDIFLAKETGVKLHLAHVSTKEAMKQIIMAKKEKVNVTCEITPHHISLFNSDYKVNPPIRSKEDVMFLIDSIKNGWVDVISTDHAPHTFLDKQNGACGISGLETAFPICFTTLVKNGYISLNKLSYLMSQRPAELMAVNKGKIARGFDADLVLVDIDKKVKINSQKFLSKGKNTPFDGKQFYGIVLATIRNGKIMYDGGINSDNR